MVPIIIYPAIKINARPPHSMILLRSSPSSSNRLIELNRRSRSHPPSPSILTFRISRHSPSYTVHRVCLPISSSFPILPWLAWWVRSQRRIGRFPRSNSSIDYLKVHRSSPTSLVRRLQSFVDHHHSYHASLLSSPSSSRPFDRSISSGNYHSSPIRSGGLRWPNDRLGSHHPTFYPSHPSIINLGFDMHPSILTRSTKSKA